MGHRGVRLACLSLVTCLASGQKFPMRYLAEVGHLEKNQTIDLGSGEIRASEASGLLTGRDRSGKPWRVSLPLTGGVGWTEVWTADFDADGQRDLLLGKHFPGNGSCVDGVELTVLLFDASGRPMPWTASSYLPQDQTEFPYLPVLAMDADRDGRAEFVFTVCERGPYGSYSIAGFYEANTGRLDLVRTPKLEAYRQAAGPLPAQPSMWRDLMPGLDRTATDRLEELTRSFHFDEKMTISGRVVKRWADNTILDGPDGREICLGGCRRELEQILRYGYAVKWIDPGEGSASWIWADLYQPARPARVDVDLQIITSRRMRATRVPADGGCFEVSYAGEDSTEVTIIRRCPASGMWECRRGGSDQALLPDKRSVRTAHTAMNHTVSFETRFERPPGGGALQGIAETQQMILAHWNQGGRRLFSLHGTTGELIVWRVHVPVHADLVAGDSALIFLNRTRRLGSDFTVIHGRLRWRRETDTLKSDSPYEPEASPGPRR